MRRRAAAFASVVRASEETTHAVALAVSETVTNALVHAYVGAEPGSVSVRCRADDHPRDRRGRPLAPRKAGR
jgi:anti-sigma regulatory factor (Ser/Thr protein kinase)